MAATLRLTLQLPLPVGVLEQHLRELPVGEYDEQPRDDYGGRDDLKAYIGHNIGLQALISTRPNITPQ